jgi:uncharacterized NAD(P)/FAD-binding protein YdhS
MREDLMMMPLAAKCDSYDRLGTYAPVVAIVGGAFSGAKVAAQPPRKAAHSGAPESGRLLNVPASGMSVWPDRPDDLLEWARKRDCFVGPYAFPQRPPYGA